MFSKHVVLITRTKIFCAVSRCLDHTEQNMFCVVSCCLDHDNKPHLEYFWKNVFDFYFAMLSRSGGTKRKLKKIQIYFDSVFSIHFFLITKTETCFLLYHVVLIARTKYVLCCIMLSWSWQQTSSWIFLGLCRSGETDTSSRIFILVFSRHDLER